MESHLDQLVSCLLSLYLLLHLGRAAPGLPGAQRAEASLPLLNPFGAGAAERQLLQSYIQSSLKSSQGRPEISSWEQEVFFLFRLYDFDRSGFLDGLEMMKLLSDYNSHHTPGAAAGELVVSVVDFLLQTQDLNQDGLLDPSELLSPSFIHTQINGTPQQEQEVPAENVPPNGINEEEAAHEELRPQAERVKEEEEPMKRADQHNERENADVPAEQHHDVPVHQGRPEI